MDFGFEQLLQEVLDMGSLLEEMHKMRLKEKIEELENMGGNPHVEDHGLG